MDNIITADEIRTTCLPNKTFDVAKFNPHIAPTELQFLLPFLGKTFYDALRVEYLADNLSSDNETLVNTYLKPFLCWHTFSKAMPFLHVEIRNGGFYVNNSEFSTAASSAQRADLVNVAVQNAETYGDLAKKYIEDNPTLFPLYDKVDNVDNSINIVGGLILDTEE